MKRMSPAFRPAQGNARIVGAGFNRRRRLLDIIKTPSDVRHAIQQASRLQLAVQVAALERRAVKLAL